MARTTSRSTAGPMPAILVDLLVTHFRTALAPIAALDLKHAQTEVNPNYVTMATPTEEPSLIGFST